MDEKLLPLFNLLENLLQSKLEMMKALDDMMRAILELERSNEKSVNWPMVLKELKSQVYGVDINSDLRFIDEIEEALNDVSYRAEKSVQDRRMAVNPLLKHVPVYFDDLHPPFNSDYMNPLEP